MDKSAHKVVLLTTTHPKPTSAYLIERLVTEELVDAVLVVRPAGPLERCRRALNIARRNGVTAPLRRARAARLRRRELGSFRDRYLVRRLFPDGLKPLQFPSSLRVVTSDHVNSKSTAAALASMKPAIVIQAGAGLIGRPLLDIPRIGILSLHHGIMPAIRGMDSILWSFVEDRPDWAGITVQLLDEGLDTGRILTQVSVWTAPRENPFSAVATATELGADLMARSIRAILASGGTSGWHSAEIGTYKSSLTPDAVRKLKHLCQVRGDDGIEADGSRSGTPQAKRWSQSMVATAVARGRRT